jgi:hypothetical protein
MTSMMTLQQCLRRHTRQAGCHYGRLRHIEVTCVPRTGGEGFITMSGWFKFRYGSRSGWEADFEADFEVRKRYLRRSRGKPRTRRVGSSRVPSVQTPEHATQSKHDMSSTEPERTTEPVQTVSVATVDRQPEDSGGERHDGIIAKGGRIRQSVESSALENPTPGQESQEQREKPRSHEPRREDSTEGTDTSAPSDVQRLPPNETLPLGTTVDGATQTSEKLVTTFETGKPGNGATQENAKLPASARTNASNLLPVQQQTGGKLASDAPAAASKNGITEASQPRTGMPQVVPESPAASSHHGATREQSAREDAEKTSLTPVS